VILGILLRLNTPAERGLYPDNVEEAEFRANYCAAPPEMDTSSGWTTGKLLRTKEVWLCVFSTGLLMLAQMGIMSQLVTRNMELGMSQALATGVMSAIAVVGIVGSVLFGKVVVSVGVKRAGVLTGILYIVAMALNVSNIMPLAYLSLVIIGLLGAAAPNLMNSIPGSVFGRVGYAKVNSVVFPLTSIIFMLNFAVNGVIIMLFHSLTVAYIVFAVLALISILLILALQDHKYDQDYLAAHKENGSAKIS
ncbi:MAG: MFS transporter, partial [Clostridia bacterium]|nr:MFS transporter [Clostridia bacterium]